MRLLMRRTAALALGLGACTSSENESAELSIPPDSVARSLMLREKVIRSLPRSARPIAEDRLHSVTYASASIPGLIYDVAIYEAGPHTSYYAIIAQRDTVARLLRTFEDWLAVAGAWSASDEKGAVDGCVEATKFRDVRHPARYIEAYRDTGSLPTMIGIPELTGDKLYEPVVRVDSAGTWFVDMWIAKPRLMLQVSCVSGPAEKLSLVVKDSILGAGLFFW